MGALARAHLVGDLLEAGLDLAEAGSVLRARERGEQLGHLRRARHRGCVRSVAVKSVEAVRVRRVGVGVRFWAEAAEVGTEVSVVIVFVASWSGSGRGA